MRTGRGVAAALAACLLAACATQQGTAPPSAPGAAAELPQRAPAAPPERLTRVEWQQVDGWQDDPLIGVAAALKLNCTRLAARPEWRDACGAAQNLDELDPTALRAFFEQHFTPFRLTNDDGSVDGLVTGYYEPVLRGSRQQHPPYLYPLYRRPAGLPAGGTLPPRADLRRSGILNGAELVWVDDPIEAFFLQVQGSGRILLDDGSVMRVGYGGANGQPYRSIGKWLIDRGEIAPSQATMQGIKAWARAHPQQVDALLDENPRFVFFRTLPADPGDAAAADGADGPIGALGVPLTPERSIAVDPRAIPLGMAVFLSTTRPLTNQPLNRLVFAQDVGNAIRGNVRADFFWGLGDAAGDLAGRMKQSGRMWLLLPDRP